MAEAVVKDRPVIPMRYFCHMCNVEINIPNADFICPLCAGGFVEELPTAQAQLGASGSNNSTTDSSNNSNERRRDEPAPGFNALRDDLANLLMSRNASNFEITFGDDGNRHISITNPNTTGTTATSATNNSSAGNNGSGGRVRPENFDRLDNVLFDFLQTLTSGDMDASFGNPQYVLMSNPGDYAWGREGIDTIVTHLLNQMEASGPPPLSKEKIAEIPISNLTEEENKNKIQCSVCWEDFKLEETIRRLPCSHIYHESCIIPWLNLHNTCPICRKSLADENDTEGLPRPSAGGGNSNSNSNGGSAGNNGGFRSVTLAAMTGNPLTAFLRPNTQTATTTTSSGNSNSNNTGNNDTTTTSQSNVFGFDESNLDMDLD